jgi:SNF family Na+-dependent transporter
VFEVYPEAIGTLPGSQVWSFLFFLTVIMLGMDSAVNIYYLHSLSNASFKIHNLIYAIRAISLYY